MKFKKKFVAFIMVLMIVLNFSVFGTLQVFAHDEMLDITYDNCRADKDGDGIDEMWYILVDKDSFCYHYFEDNNTIKYYFEETSTDGTYTWTTDVSEAVADEIKNAYANSMKKWNNVYFYSYSTGGVVTKHKVINIVEGTASDHNLSIYPERNLDAIAYAGVVGNYDAVETGIIKHRHYSEWRMRVNLDYFYVHDNRTSDYVTVVREMVGAHEFGHVLGLRDVDCEYENGDRLCNPVGDSEDTNSDHHQEVLMGYGSMTERQYNITYKDIAGVAITRGFHTDSDHRWLNLGPQNDGKYKLVCSICNGVKTVLNLNGLSYDEYHSCGGNHDLSDGNMMAVASYGTQDYYKCKYCRYVAPFSSIVPQNYSKLKYSDSHHKCVNNVQGLEYTFYEEHEEHCPECTPHEHWYTYTHYNDFSHRRRCGCGDTVVESHQITYEPYNNKLHLDVCACGYQKTSPHVVASTPAQMAPCLVCGAMVTIGSGTIMPWGNNDGSVETNALDNGIRYVTENGSYILPNGVIVLVSEDIEAYFNGELIFYDLKEQLEAS